MRRILIPAFLCFGAMLCACSASTEKSASRDYVKASQKVVAAASYYDSADYKKALELCIDAQKNVDAIISQFPESSIALKVVTDPSTRIGACSYIDLSSKIIPQLNNFNMPLMADSSFAWVIANSRADVAAKDAALEVLAKLLISTKSDQKKIYACILEIKNPNTKSELMELMKSSAEVAPSSDGITSKKVISETKAIDKIDDVKLFLSQAKSEAALVSYDLRAIDSLKNRSLRVKNVDTNTAAEFAKILTVAYTNILKISVPNMREAALANMAIVFANSGDDKRAIAIAQNLKSPELFTDVFRQIASKASEGKNYVDAIALASRLPEGIEKQSFLIELVNGVAKQGLIDSACDVAKVIHSQEGKNIAFASIAKVCIENSNKKNLDAIIGNIDISKDNSFKWLSVFVPDNKLSSDFEKGMAIASVNDILSPNLENKDFLKSINKYALTFCDKIKDDNSKFAILANEICVNMAEQGDFEAALAYLIDNVHMSKSNNSFKSICNVASKAVKKDIKLADKAFYVAANICESFSDSDSYNQSKAVVYLAWSIQKSGVSASDSAKILKAFLPKFH